MRVLNYNMDILLNMCYHLTGVDTYCVVVGKIGVRVSNMIKSNNYNIVRAQWLINCLENNTLLPWYVVS